MRIKAKRGGGFRSALERSVANNLKRRGVQAAYEEDTLSYKIEAEYTPDFRLPNGIFVEVKGVLRKEDRRKMVAVKRCNPDADIRFVFALASKAIVGGKISHAKWAERNGFPWAEGHVPEEWIDEGKSRKAKLRSKA